MSELGALRQLRAACASCPELVVEGGRTSRGATVRRRTGQKVAGYRLTGGAFSVRTAVADLRRRGWPVEVPR